MLHEGLFDLPATSDPGMYLRRCCVAVCGDHRVEESLLRVDIADDNAGESDLALLPGLKMVEVGNLSFWDLALVVLGRINVEPGGILLPVRLKQSSRER